MVYNGICDSTLRLPRETGGISLHDLNLKRISCRMKFIRDFLDNSQENRMAFAGYYLSATARDVLGTARHSFAFACKIPHVYLANRDAWTYPILRKRAILQNLP